MCAVFCVFDDSLGFLTRVTVSFNQIFCWIEGSLDSLKHTGTERADMMLVVTSTCNAEGNSLAKEEYILEKATAREK